MNKNISIGVIAAVALILGFIAFKAPSVISVPTEIKFDASALGSAKAPVVNVPAPIVNVAAPQVSVNVPQQQAPQVVSQSLGSVTSPDLPQPNFSVGGLREWSERRPLLTSASTTCSFKLTTASSSMLVRAGASIATSSTGGVFEIGYSPISAYATTTLIAQKTISAGATDFVVSTSSTAMALGNLNPSGVMQPGGFIVMKYSAGLVAGSCFYRVQEI